MPPARNIELKARLADLAAAKTIASRLATSHLGTQRQRDVYFAATHSRLKLREIDGGAAQLIAYNRADRPDAKASDYHLVELRDADTAAQLRELLAAALGITVVVEKCRDVFLYYNVRIHLDEVVGLGEFLEFEAVVTDEIDDQAARRQVARLQNEFGIAAADLMSRSYADMLLERAYR